MSFYSKYQEWVDAGRPYWAGLSLFNQVKGWPVLKRTLGRGPSKYNTPKLDGMLARYLAKVPGTRATDAPAPAAPPTVQAVKALTELGPDRPVQLSEKKKQAVPFAALPEVLQKRRIEAIELERTFQRLHTQLSDGIADEPLRRSTCAAIVATRDKIDAIYDAEDLWTAQGLLPVVPEGLRERLQQLSELQLADTLRNQVLPRISRAKKAIGKHDGEKLAEARMRLAEAEQERDMIRAIMHERQQARDASIDADPPKAKARATAPAKKKK